MTSHLLVAEGARAAVPGTGFTLAVDSVRHRIGSTGEGEIARSMMTAVLTLFEGGRQVAQGRAIDGERLRLGTLAVTLIGRGADPSTVELDVGP